MVPVGGIGGGDGAVAVCGSVWECGEGDWIREFLCALFIALLACTLGTGAGEARWAPCAALASEPAPGA